MRLPPLTLREALALHQRILESGGDILALAADPDDLALHLMAALISFGAQLARDKDVITEQMAEITSLQATLDDVNSLLRAKIDNHIADRLEAEDEATRDEHHDVRVTDNGVLIFLDNEVVVVDERSERRLRFESAEAAQNYFAAVPRRSQADQTWLRAWLRALGAILPPDAEIVLEGQVEGVEWRGPVKNYFDHYEEINAELAKGISQMAQDALRHPSTSHEGAIEATEAGHKVVEEAPKDPC